MKRMISMLAMALMALGLMAGAVMADEHPGAGEGSDQATPPDHATQSGGQTQYQGNSLAARAEPVADVNVTVLESDPDKDNFEEEFTYYRVDYEEVTYDTWVYREPSRLDEDFVLEDLDGATSSTFWFGVSAPGSSGVQHAITHNGEVTQYFEVDDGKWKSLTAEFSDGELQTVNGESVSQ